jgi:hypothetical protein
METSAIILSIDSELATLRQVRELLIGTSNGHAPRVTRKRQYVMSAEAREKIAAAQRKRWAKQRRAAKKAA